MPLGGDDPQETALGIDNIGIFQLAAAEYLVGRAQAAALGRHDGRGWVSRTMSPALMTLVGSTPRKKARTYSLAGFCKISSGVPTLDHLTALHYGDAVVRCAGLRPKSWEMKTMGPLMLFLQREQFVLHLGTG